MKAFSVAASFFLFASHSFASDIILKAGQKVELKPFETAVVECGTPVYSQCTLEKRGGYFYIIKEGRELSQPTGYLHSALQFLKQLQDAGVCPK